MKIENPPTIQLTEVFRSRRGGLVAVLGQPVALPGPVGGALGTTRHLLPVGRGGDALRAHVPHRHFHGDGRHVRDRLFVRHGELHQEPPFECTVTILP